MPRRKQPEPEGVFARLWTVFTTAAGGHLPRMLGASVLLLIGGLAMQGARAQAWELEDHRVRPANLEIVDLPEWALASSPGESTPGPLTRLLRDKSFYAFDVSIFDAHAEATVREAVARHPLVASVGEVRVRYPNRAEVEVDVRVPIARFKTKARHPSGDLREVTRLLCRDGATLPLRPYRDYLARLGYDLPWVTGIATRPPRDPGVVWEDTKGRVAEAIAAAHVGQRILRDSRGRLAVTRIDVSRFPNTGSRRHEGEVLLHLRDRGVGADLAGRDWLVQWGRTERDLRGVTAEDPYGVKLRRLREILATPGTGPRIDVRWDMRLPRISASQE